MNGGAVGPEIATPCAYATVGSRSIPSHSIRIGNGMQEARNTSQLCTRPRIQTIGAKTACQLPMNEAVTIRGEMRQMCTYVESQVNGRFELPVAVLRASSLTLSATPRFRPPIRDS